MSNYQVTEDDMHAAVEQMVNFVTTVFETVKDIYDAQGTKDAVLQVVKDALTQFQKSNQEAIIQAQKSNQEAIIQAQKINQEVIIQALNQRSIMSREVSLGVYFQEFREINEK